MREDRTDSTDPMMGLYSGEPRAIGRDDSMAHNREMGAELLSKDRFKAYFEQVVSNQLSPENIDTYADDSLTKLIGLVDEMLENYRKLSPSSLEGRELEDAALKYYGLAGMAYTLDVISAKAAEIKHIGALTSRIENVDSIIVPTETGSRPIGEREQPKPFEEKLTIQRTKTILFILANDFGVDLDDLEQLSVTTGIMNENMMRKLSYVMIDAPGIERTVLCCDEEGNVTYVFDSALIEASGIEKRELMNYTKPEINKMIHEHPEIGRRIVYSDKFVGNIIEFLRGVDTRHDQEEGGEVSAQYLYPNAPEGVLSVRGITKKLDVASGVVPLAIKRLEETLGETNYYRFRSKTAIGYTPEQQAMIENDLAERGLFADEPPEGTESVSGVANLLSVGDVAIRTAIAGLGDDLGETRQYKFHSIKTTGYNPVQQEQIRQYLESHGLLAEKAPAETLSIPGIARKYHVNEKTVKDAVESLGEALGEAQEYSFANNITAGYSPVQQEQIGQYLESHGLLAEKAPEGVLSLFGVAKMYGVSRKLVKKAIDKLGDELGETKVYKFGSLSVPGYTTDQQSLIRKHLEESGVSSEIAPEGVLSAKGLSEKLNVGRKAIVRATQDLEEDLGETRQYYFRNNLTIGYTEEQQDAIEAHLRRQGQIA